MNRPTMTLMSDLVTTDGEFVEYRAVGNVVLTATRKGDRYFMVRGDNVHESEAGATMVVSEILRRWVA